MTQPPATESSFHESDLWVAIESMRPRLHRLAARITGSVIDGEDAIQDAFAKALAAWSSHPPRKSVEGWLVRIAYRSAIDLTGRRRRAALLNPRESLEAMPDTTSNRDADSRIAVEAALHSFMFLTPIERSCVVLKDVLDFRMTEIVNITGASLLAVKAALHRGRRRLREVADLSAEASTPSLDANTRSLLARYAERFNAHDFDGVCGMLAEEVEVEVVARARLRGRAAIRHTYFGNYATSGQEWTLEPGAVEGLAALLVYTSTGPAVAPDYFILVECDQGVIARARDFRHARYVMEAARFTSL